MKTEFGGGEREALTRNTDERGDGGEWNWREIRRRGGRVKGAGGRRVKAEGEEVRRVRI